MDSRVVVISDIHGNLPALQSVAASLPDADRVIVAGDHCLDGPAPAQVVDLLRERGWVCLVGNTDRDIVQSDGSGLKGKRVAWAREQLGRERLAWLGDLPFSVAHGSADGGLLVVHANPLNLDDQLHPTLSEGELEPYLSAVAQPVVAFGHLHTPYLRPVGKHLLVDVSSVGHPKDRDHRSVVTVFSWSAGARRIEQLRIPYDLEATASLLRESEMPGADKQIDALYRASY